MCLLAVDALANFGKEENLIKTNYTAGFSFDQN